MYKKEGISMGFFQMPDQESNRVDSGIVPGAARKSGLPRMWELINRDLWNNLRAGFLAMLGCVPFAAGMIFSVSTHAILFAPVLGFLGGCFAGPELCGLADTLLRGLRDEPGFWWYTYRKAWKRSARSALLPGGVGGAFLSIQLFLLFHSGTLNLGLATIAALVMATLLTLGLSIYLWPQLALTELPFGQLIRNAVLLFIGQLPRSVAALVFLAGYTGLFLYFSELAVCLSPLTNLWLPALPALFIIYPGLEKAFQLESRTQKEENSV